MNGIVKIRMALAAYNVHPLLNDEAAIVAKSRSKNRQISGSDPKKIAIAISGNSPWVIKAGEIPDTFIVTQRSATTVVAASK